MKILLVEDQKDMRDILTKRLKKEYSVDACADGNEALDYLSVYIYDMLREFLSNSSTLSFHH